MYECMCFTVIKILPVCSLNCESQPWCGEKSQSGGSTLLLAETSGRKWKVLPLFHTPATTHTDSAASQRLYVCIWVCVPKACECLHVVLLWSDPHFFFFFLRITALLHEVFESIFAQSAAEQCVLTVLGRYYFVASAGRDLTCLASYTHQTSCS